MGCVGQAGEQGNNVARGAVLASRFPEERAGHQRRPPVRLLAAGPALRRPGGDERLPRTSSSPPGVESMTRVPMGTPVILPAQNGLGTPMSPRQQARYPTFQFSQFMGAEMVAAKYGLTKDQLDEYSYPATRRRSPPPRAAPSRTRSSLSRSPDADGTKTLHTVDEGIRFDAQPRGHPRASSCCRRTAKLTAASSSQICDGASGVMVVSEAGLKTLGVDPIARIHHLTLVGGDPVIMLEAPIPATKRALAKAGMTIDDIDLFEVNEAFASVPVAWAEGDPAPIPTASTSTAAPSRWATRSAPREPS